MKQTLKHLCLKEVVVYISLFMLLYCFISPSAITLSASVMLINHTVEINLGDVLLPAVIKILLNGYNFWHCLPQKRISPSLISHLSAMGPLVPKFCNLHDCICFLKENVSTELQHLLTLNKLNNQNIILFIVFISCDVEVNESAYSINDSQKKAQTKIYISPLSSVDFCHMLSW